MPSQVTIYHDFMRVFPITVWVEGQYEPRTTGSVTFVRLPSKIISVLHRYDFWLELQKECVGLLGQLPTSIKVKNVAILRQLLGYFVSLNLTQYSEKGLQTAACRHNPACEAISSSFKRTFYITRKFFFQENFDHLVECKIFQNNHIT